MLLPLLQGISLAMVPLLSIGPFKVFVLSSAINQGWRRALPLATAPLVADILIITVSWVVLQQVPDWSIDALRVLGGLFYIYLAARLIRSARTQLTPQMLDVEHKRSYRQAILIVWISPAAWINWSVIGVPAMITYSEQSPAYAIAFLVGFYTVWVGGLAAQIWLVGQADRVLETRTSYLVYGGTVLLIAFGIYQIWEGGSSLLVG